MSKQLNLEVVFLSLIKYIREGIKCTSTLVKSLLYVLLCLVLFFGGMYFKRIYWRMSILLVKFLEECDIWLNIFWDNKVRMNRNVQTVDLKKTRTLKGLKCNFLWINLINYPFSLVRNWVKWALIGELFTGSPLVQIHNWVLISLHNLSCFYSFLIQVKQLLSLPSEKKIITVKKILSGIGITVAGAAIISGIYLSVKK